MNEALLARIESALVQIEPIASHSFEPGLSIRRQLQWCREFVCGVTCESTPGALTSWACVASESRGPRSALPSVITGSDT